MTPDITELDEDYEPRGDSNITVNGKLPGNGGDGLWTTDDDGNLVPVDASAVSVDQATIGPSTGGVTGIEWDRPEINKAERTVLVPDDEPTPQDAFRKIPRRLAANYTIRIDETGDFSGEDWVIPPVMSEEIYDATEGANTRLTINRQGTSGSLNPNSVFAIGGRGQGSVTFVNTYPVGVNPYTNEPAVWTIFGGQQLKLSNCGVGGSSRTESDSVGVMSYSSLVKLEDTFDWGNDLVDIGGRTKQGGMIVMPTGVSTAGSVKNTAWLRTTGIIQHGLDGPTAANNFASDPQRQDAFSHLLSMVDKDGNLFDFVTADSQTRIRDKNNNDRILLQDSGDIVFRNPSGTNVARLDSSGNLTLQGSLTENGSP